MGKAEDAIPLSLKVNRVQVPVHNLGPGRRIGIWLQGCTLACAGCVSPSLWSREGGRDVDVEAFARWIAGRSEGFDGVTISGGEPFEQYGPLMAFCAYAKLLAAVDVVVYSGLRFEEIRERFPDRAFLRYVDHLVDGRYERGSHDEAGWRGSSNQRLFSMVDGAAVERPDGWPSGVLSVAVPDASSVYLAGIPRSGALATLARDLREAGRRVRFE